VGRGAHLREGIQIVGSADVSIGSEAFINVGCFIDASAAVAIGDNVRVGDHVRLITSTHEIGPSERRAGPGKSAPVIIEAGCWLGSGVVVLPGVTIRRGSVVAAGAVVASDLPADALYGGVPARRIRDLA
jgi:acetyltransferase-like isoleucine patch superfamily enzyme